MQESQLSYINQCIETGNSCKFLKTNWLDLENLKEWRAKYKRTKKKEEHKTEKEKEEKRQGKPQTTPPKN
jgi:hypothetical protein